MQLPRGRLVTELTNLFAVAALAIFGLALVVLLLRQNKFSEFSLKRADLTLVLNSIAAVQKAQEQFDRSVRDEISRNRQEQANQSRALRVEVGASLAGISDSVSAHAESLTRTNDQKLELLRSGIEHRLDSFATESGRKIDSLTQSVATSAGKLQDE